jgi:hypothetical protein
LILEIRMYGRAALLSGHICRTAIYDLRRMVRTKLNLAETGTSLVDLIAIEQFDLARVELAIGVRLKFSRIEFKDRPLLGRVSGR